MSRDATSSLAAQIDARLSAPGAMDAARFASFLEGQRRLGLTHGDRALCRHLRPYLIAEQDYAAVARAAERIAAALERVARRALVDAALAEELGLSADERALAALDPGEGPFLTVGRLDMLVAEGGFSFIEYNADSPAGITDQLLIERTLMDLPHLSPLRGLQGVRTPAPHRALLRALREGYAAWGGREPRPTIAIVDWKAADTLAEFKALSDLFSAEGHRTRILDPDELERDGDRLSAGGEPIDLVYRRVITQELVARRGVDHPLIRAYRDRAAYVANSFRTKPLNKKAAFAVLSAPEFADLFSPEQRAAIAEHIPWTRRVRAGRTSWRGRDVDLLELIAAEQESFVLKPNDDYGGKGVLLGWQTPADAWRAAVRDAEAQRAIVQERGRARTARMPTFRDGGVVEEDVYFDLGPFVFAGRMEGAMVRLSASALSNVSAGGGVTGLMIVDDARLKREDIRHV
ncbi:MULTISPECIES: hypothetical protein [Sorangium]|uniref:Glutathionylspermidine synthase pre-ATP-grasp-like domain-containing protein n=1 Tax=Sorangium cellulosum TaxID=56 RepID=A0A4V0NFS3_SORCE|nr:MULTISPECIES: hypothetical protein [Sorangium]AUX30672.1 hypothetical protein SOCE836_027830 [Sorangium cellulosum]WCQ90061.1 hypothetical protein NQZ70_02762 [Sorangium sp. Soce836]